MKIGGNGSEIRLGAEYMKGGEKKRETRWEERERMHWRRKWQKNSVSSPLRSQSHLLKTISPVLCRNPKSHEPRSPSHFSLCFYAFLDLGPLRTLQFFLIHFKNSYFLFKLPRHK